MSYSYADPQTPAYFRHGGVKPSKDQRPPHPKRAKRVHYTLAQDQLSFDERSFFLCAFSVEGFRYLGKSGYEPGVDSWQRALNRRGGRWNLEPDGHWQEAAVAIVLSMISQGAISRRVRHEKLAVWGTSGTRYGGRHALQTARHGAGPFRDLIIMGVLCVAELVVVFDTIIVRVQTALTLAVIVSCVAVSFGACFGHTGTY